VAVPIRNGADVELTHFWRPSSSGGIWQQSLQTITAGVVGPASLIQSDWGDGDHGNFELTVPLRAGANQASLWHFWHDNSDPENPWQHEGEAIVTDVVGPGSLVQSDYRGGGHGNLELVVPLRAGSDRANLWHYWHDASAGPAWQHDDKRPIAVDVAGPATLIQGDYGDGHRNLELAVPLANGEVWHYWRDASDPELPWQRGQLITSAAGGWVALTQSDVGREENGHGDFEVLAEELSQSLVAYWHPNEEVSLPWLRGQVLLGEPAPPPLAATRKVVQLTGELDREDWDPAAGGSPNYAYNRTESQPAGIRGCDLGASFPHAGRIHFLFGDTVRKPGSDQSRDLDGTAVSDERDASGGLHLEFHLDPPLIHPPVSQRAFEVPLDGTSLGGRMHVFFSSGHREVDGAHLMGRSLLATCVDEVGNRYARGPTLSNRFFVNVSVEQGVLDDVSAALLEWPRRTPVLWIWGSGRYRGSDVRLAVVPLDGLETLAEVRFFAGRDDEPRWSADESEATPVIANGAVGELSVRWNPQLERFLALFNSDNPGGILLHSAAAAWGPWSRRPLVVFEPWHGVEERRPGDGIGRFMHRSWRKPRIDWVNDDLLPGDSPGERRREYVDGGVYGPYQIAPCATGEAGVASRIYFTMSTWNPYQVMLMTTEVAVGDLLDRER
jgi:hypothetical protein